MDIKNTIKNWRWWIAVLTWYPIAAPFAVIQVLLSWLGSALEDAGSCIRNFSDYRLDEFLKLVFQSRRVRRWVFQGDDT